MCKENKITGNFTFYKLWWLFECSNELKDLLWRISTLPTNGSMLGRQSSSTVKQIKMSQSVEKYVDSIYYGMSGSRTFFPK